MSGPSEPAAPRRFDVGQVAATAVTIFAIGAAAWLFASLSQVLLLVFAALVLAAIFDALARILTRWTPLSHGPALAVAILGLLLLFAGVFALFGAQLAGEFDTIRARVPAAIDAVQAFLDRFGLGEPARGLLSSGNADLSRLAARAGSYLVVAGSGVANIVLVLVGGIFIASDPGVYRNGLLAMVPQRAEPTVAAALDDASRGLRGWMFGQAVSSLVVAGLTWGGLALLGVPAAGGLGLVAGLLDVIPMVGPIIAGVPAVLMAFTVSPATALWTVGIFLAIQQLQGNFLQPMIQKQAVDVPPAVLLFALVAAGSLFGFLGVLLAAPLTVVVFVMVQRIYVRTLLGKPLRIAGED